MAGTAKPQLDPQSVMQSWAQGLASATAGAKYKRKIALLQSSGKSPPKMAATPQALQDYQNGCTQSVTSGRRAAALNSQKATDYYFMACLGSGADKLMASAMDPVKQQKYLDAAQTWAPIWAQASAQAAAVTGPKGADSTITAKVLASVHVMKSAAKRGSMAGGMIGGGLALA